MYGTNIVRTGLTLGKVLSGISRGLTIANQVIPLYQQAKPMINNARKVMSVLKEFNSVTPTNNNNSNIITEKKEEAITPNIIKGPKSSPVFFQ